MGRAVVYTSPHRPSRARARRGRAAARRIAAATAAAGRRPRAADASDPGASRALGRRRRRQLRALPLQPRGHAAPRSGRAATTSTSAACSTRRASSTRSTAVPPRAACWRCSGWAAPRHHERAGARRARPLRRVRAIRVYNGGADFTRYDAPLAFGFSPATVLDEFTLPADGVRRRPLPLGPPLSGAEDHAFEVGVQHVHRACTPRWRRCRSRSRAKACASAAFKIAYDAALARAPAAADRSRPRRRTARPRAASRRGTCCWTASAACPRPGLRGRPRLPVGGGRGRGRRGPVTRALRPARARRSAARRSRPWPATRASRPRSWPG